MREHRLEAQFKQMAAEFPDSPMAHFSLGKLYLERRRYAEAVEPWRRAVRIWIRSYAAALVSLGDAYAGAAGHKEPARAALEQARSAAVAQGH